MKEPSYSNALFGLWASFGIRHSCFVILVAFLPLINPALAEKRNITEKDLFDFVWIGDPQISPDGWRVAFVRVTVNEKKDGYNTSIWSVPLAGNEPPHQLTKGEHDAAPRWSPDGKMIAFTSDANPEDVAKQEKKKKKEEEQKKAALSESPSSKTASPSAKSSASPSPEKDDGKKKADANSAEAEGEHESDIHIVTRAVYREDNEGYLDPKHPQHIWIVNAPHNADEKVQPKQLTSGRFDEDNLLWSKEGDRILFTTNRVDEPYYDLPKTDLYSVSINGGDPTKITTIDGDANDLSLSPDGRQVAFIASAVEPVNSYTQPDLWVIDLTPNAKPRNLTGKFDFDMGNGVFGDNAAPRAGGGNTPIWAPDGKSLLEIYGKEGRTILASFDLASGTPTDLTHGNQAVHRFRATADHSKIVYSSSSATRINDLFALAGSGEPQQLTHVNDELFSQLNLTEPEEVTYNSFDGKKIQAWLQKPPGFDPAKKYPLILNIHGGPHAAYGWIFEHEFQWMAAKGYVVLYPNPRGSTTYGQDFGNVIQYHYPGDDYKDLMTGVDEVIKRGYIEEKKLGVTGGSGGGLLTNWVVGQTQRFAAAVAQRDIASWADWWYTADFTLFKPNWFRAPPFEDEQDFKARSPISYIKNVKTPMMFILGEADYRTPPGAGGEEMFRALKFRKIPAVMVRFPNESHELSRSGGPWHRVERLQHIVGWFDRWLMGVAKPEYDVAPQQEVAIKHETTAEKPAASPRK